MFHVIVHVPIEETVDKVHVDRPAVKPVIENVLRQPGMLGQPVNYQQPGAEKISEPD